MKRIGMLTLALCTAAAFAAGGDLPSDSIYQLPSKWTDQNAAKISLDKLGGQPTVLTLIYTSCPTICPLTVADMSKLDAAIPAAQRAKVRYVLISLDSARDNPATLKKFVAKFRLDERWRMLTGSEDDVREIAATLGFQYKKMPDGEYSHATTQYLLNSKGQILAKRTQGEDTAPFVAEIGKQLKP